MKRYDPPQTFGLTPDMHETSQGEYVRVADIKPRVAVYPGSFNPWHAGHQDVLEKARLVFDEVRVLQMANPDKEPPPHCEAHEVTRVGGLLVDYLRDHPEVCAVVRGLRNGEDLEESKSYQYWNEDLGTRVPFVHFVTDRALLHYSSSALRALKKFGIAWAH